MGRETVSGSAGAPPRLLISSALAVAVLGVATAAPLVRLSSASALAVAFWRLALGTAVTATFWLATSRGGAAAPSSLPPRRGRDGALAAAAGAALALHFAAWMSSLELTSVAASVVLVNTQPVFAAAFATVFLRETLRGAQWLGMGVALVGAAMVSLDSVGSTSRAASFQGNLLALLGAAAAAAYYVIGRSLRPRQGLWPYVTRVYAVAAAVLLGVAVVAGVRLAPFPASDWAIFAALVLGPTLLGHTVVNWTLRWVAAPIVNVVLLGEPIGAALLAALIPAIDEVPGAWTWTGGAVTLAGIALVLRGGLGGVSSAAQRGRKEG